MKYTSPVMAMELSLREMAIILMMGARQIKAELRRRLLQRKAREERYLKELLHEEVLGGKRKSKPGSQSGKLDAATEAKIAAQAEAMAAAEASAAAFLDAGGSSGGGGLPGGASTVGSTDGPASAEGSAMSSIDVMG